MLMWAGGSARAPGVRRWQHQGTWGGQSAGAEEREGSAAAGEGPCGMCTGRGKGRSNTCAEVKEQANGKVG